MWTPVLLNGITQINGNTFRKTGGTNNTWSSSVHSIQGYARGAYCSARASSTSGNVMFGLNTDPTTDDSFSSIDYAWYFDNGTVRIYENGSLISSPTTYTTSTVLSITYDGYNVRYYVDATLQRTVARAISSSALYFDSSFFSTNVEINSVAFGPMGEQGSQGIQGIQGQQGIQGTQGTTGQQGITGAQGIQGRQGITGAQGTQGRQGITGSQGTQGIQGVQGVIGAQGTQGRQGITGSQGLTGTEGDNAGLRFNFNSTTTQADPGTGLFRLNNASIAGATSIYIDDLDVNSVNHRAFFTAWNSSNSTNKGYILIDANLNSSATFGVFQLTSISQPTGYSILNVTYVSGTTPTNGQECVITFSATGNSGTQGTQGSQGSQGIQGRQGIQGITGPIAGSNGQLIYNDNGQSGGTDQGFYQKSSGFFGFGNTSPSQRIHITGNVRVSGAFYDSNNDPGISGQILSSTATGTDWIDLTTAYHYMTINTDKNDIQNYGKLIQTTVDKDSTVNISQEDIYVDMFTTNTLTFSISSDGNLVATF